MKMGETNTNIHHLFGGYLSIEQLLFFSDNTFMKLIELCPITKLQRQQLQQNYQILKQEVDKFGKEYQKKSYEEILLFSDQDVIINSVGNSQISCSVEAYHRQKNGTIAVSIDAYGLPTILGIKPSYHFYKRVDGSVYY